MIFGSIRFHFRVWIFPVTFFFIAGRVSVFLGACVCEVWLALHRTNATWYFLSFIPSRPHSPSLMPRSHVFSHLTLSSPSPPFPPSPFLHLLPSQTPFSRSFPSHSLNLSLSTLSLSIPVTFPPHVPSVLLSSLLYTFPLSPLTRSFLQYETLSLPPLPLSFLFISHSPILFSTSIPPPIPSLPFPLPVLSLSHISSPLTLNSSLLPLPLSIPLHFPHSPSLFPTPIPPPIPCLHIFLSLSLAPLKFLHSSPSEPISSHTLSFLPSYLASLTIPLPYFITFFYLTRSPLPFP